MIQNTTVTSTCTGNGVTSVFNTTFKAFEFAQVEVWLGTDISYGTKLTLNTHYSLSNFATYDAAGLDADNEVIVTMYTAPENGAKLRVLRNTLATQSVNIRTSRAFDPTVFETALDRITMMLQEQGAVTLGSIRVENVQLPPIIAAPNVSLVFDASGTSIVAGPTVTDISGASAAGAAASASAAAAAVTLAQVQAVALSLLTWWKGQWLTATVYTAGQAIVQESGNAYVCISTHTSGTFATDLAASKWQLFVSKGSTGPGSGDVLGSNNGSEFIAGASTFRANLAIAGDIQTVLASQDILALTTTRGTFYNIGTSITNGPTGGANGDMIFVKGVDTNNKFILWFYADGTLAINKKTSGSWGGWIKHTKETDLDRILHIRDERASGTHAGTFTSGSYQTRPLQTVKYNNISGASLASNQFILPAGTYEIEASAIAYKVEFHKIRLRNITDGSDTLIGMSGNSQDTERTAAVSRLKGRFVIAGTKTFELQHRCDSTGTTTGMGKAVSYGDVEVYADVYITKIA